MLELGVVSENEVAGAMDAPQPFTELQRLLTTSYHRLKQTLHALVRRHSHGYGADWDRVFTIGFGPINMDDPPSIEIRMDGYCMFEVGTIHQIPPSLAGWVCQSFELISRCLLSCMLPGEMWAGEYVGGAEFYREEYEQIKDAVDIENLQAVAAYTKAHDLFYFGHEPASVAHQLALARHMFDECPAWIKPQRSRAPLQQAQRLQKQVAQYVRSCGAHAWCSYVQEVCAALMDCYENDKAVGKQQRAQAQPHFERQEQEVPLWNGLWVFSGSDCEQYHAESLYDTMSQAGEYPINRYSLTALTSSQLRRLLHHTAIGMGLLLRAMSIDEAVRRTKG